MTSWSFFQGYEIFPEVAKAANEFADQVCIDETFDYSKTSEWRVGQKKLHAV